MQRFIEALKDRQNITFFISLILAIATPVLAYAGITAKDITTWAKVGELIKLALSNPYVLGLIFVNVWNSLNNPTTLGVIPEAVAESSEDFDIEDEDLQEEEDEFEEDIVDEDEDVVVVE